MPPAREPTYALQMARPFWTLLARYPQVPREALEGTDAAPDDLRLSVPDGQRFLHQMTELTGEPDLGLLAARETKLGAFDVLEFVAFSAPTWRAALETLFRYIHLMNEAADFRIETVGDQARIVLHSTVPLTRAGIDFQSAALHIATTRWFGQQPPELEVHFTYAEPDDVSQHRAVFGDAELVFDAPWNGFIFGAFHLEKKLTSADPSVHQVLRDHADRLLQKLAPGDSLVERIRAQLLESLKEGPLTAEAVAASMGITRRTLTRRLRQEGTSFTELLEDIRHQAALHYLDTTDHSLDDIAFLVGFSESSAFVRAFKRWQGASPTAYRRGRQGN